MNSKKETEPGRPEVGLTPTPEKIKQNAALKPASPPTRVQDSTLPLPRHVEYREEADHLKRSITFQLPSIIDAYSIPSPVVEQFKAVLLEVVGNLFKGLLDTKEVQEQIRSLAATALAAQASTPRQ